MSCPYFGTFAAMKNQELVYIAYHKPKGIITTTEKIPNNIIDAVKHPQKLLPVGRLDKASEGLILLTNNKSIIDKITNPVFAHEKEYIVTLNLPIRNAWIKQMEDGVNIGDVVTKPCKITPEPNAKRIFRIVLKQGVNRQIRRMCNVFNYQVIKLQRVRIMNIQLGKLKVGEWRDLTEEELHELFGQLK